MKPFLIIENWKIERFTKVESVVTKEVKEMQEKYKEKLSKTAQNNMKPSTEKSIPKVITETKKASTENKKVTKSTLKENPIKTEQKVEVKKEQKLSDAENPNMRLMGEEERLETLKNLKQVKGDLEAALEKLPVTLKTVALVKKKLDMEKKIDDLNKAIESFSKPKVYIALE